MASANHSAGKSRSSSSAGSTKGGPAASKKKISDRLNPKTIDIFATTKPQSAFISLYSDGAVPCRLVHGSVRHKLSWSTVPEEVSFDPVLVILSQGLQEDIHPYSFVAQYGFKEMLESVGAAEKTVPLLSKIVPNIRIALNHKNCEVFERALSSLAILSDTVQGHLNPHLKMLLVPVSKRGMERRHQEAITNTLMRMEQNGGKDATMMIKSKVPTYTSVI